MSSARGSHAPGAGTTSSLERNTGTRCMGGLEGRNGESAERIKSLMCTFEDLTRLDSSGVQVLLRQVEKDQLAMALKGGTDDIKDLFFKNMSERAGKMMKEDMEAMGPVRLSEVDEAQSAVVTTAKALADSGEIVLSSGAEDDELVF